MGKAREHIRKQLDKAKQRALDIYAEDDPEATLRAAFKAMGVTDEQIDAKWSRLKKIAKKT